MTLSNARRLGVNAFSTSPTQLSTGTLGAWGRPLQYSKRLVIGRDQGLRARRPRWPCCQTGHAASNRQITDRFAAKYSDNIAGCHAAVPGFTDHGHGDVLGRHTGGKLAVISTFNVPWTFFWISVCVASTVVSTSEVPIRGPAEPKRANGVAVWLSPADNSQSRQGPALSGPTDMHDALTPCGHRGNVAARIPWRWYQAQQTWNAAVFVIVRGRWRGPAWVGTL